MGIIFFCKALFSAIAVVAVVVALVSAAIWTEN